MRRLHGTSDLPLSSGDLTWQLRAGGKHDHDESFAQSMVEGWALSWRNEIDLRPLVDLYHPVRDLAAALRPRPASRRATRQGLLPSVMGLGAPVGLVVIASFGDRERA